MLAKCALLAAILMFVGAAIIAEELAFLRASARIILREYGWHLAAAFVAMYLNVVAALYLLARRLLLKDTGRKLAHIDRQLRTRDTIVRDLSERLSRED